MLLLSDLIERCGLPAPAIESVRLELTLAEAFHDLTFTHRDLERALGRVELLGQSLQLGRNHALTSPDRVETATVVEDRLHVELTGTGRGQALEMPLTLLAKATKLFLLLFERGPTTPQLLLTLLLGTLSNPQQSIELVLGSLQVRSPSVARAVSG